MSDRTACLEDGFAQGPLPTGARAVAVDLTRLRGGPVGGTSLWWVVEVGVLDPPPGCERAELLDLVAGLGARLGLSEGRSRSASERA